MPIYDFKCKECGRISEIFLRGTDSGTVRCPGCGSEHLEKLFSVPYVVRGEASLPGTTCCGRTERCEAPPCSTDDVCRRR